MDVKGGTTIMLILNAEGIVKVLLVPDSQAKEAEKLLASR